MRKWPFVIVLLSYLAVVAIVEWPTAIIGLLFIVVLVVATKWKRG